MPALRQIMKIPEEDRNQMFRLFGIRVKLWKGEALPADDQLFLDTARLQTPSWALFLRQTISADDRHAQDEAERATTKGLGELFARADKVKSISEKDGLQRFTATLDLKKRQRAVKRERVMVGAHIPQEAAPRSLESSRRWRHIPATLPSSQNV